jgi:hypothetical protein
VLIFWFFIQVQGAHFPYLSLANQSMNSRLLGFYSSQPPWDVILCTILKSLKIKSFLVDAHVF